jgi:hypothetical protein
VLLLELATQKQGNITFKHLLSAHSEQSFTKKVKKLQTEYVTSWLSQQVEFDWIARRSPITSPGMMSCPFCSDAPNNHGNVCFFYAKRALCTPNRLHVPKANTSSLAVRSSRSVRYRTWRE